MRKSIVIAVLITVALPAAALAEDPPTLAATGTIERMIGDYEARTRLPETVVTPTRGARSLFVVPRAVTVIGEETIREQSPIQLVRTMTLRDPGIVMDMRTTTTGDPIMRGFAGNNLLTLIDGNSLTTLWGEGGDGADDMYGKVDPDTVERIEIVRGPNSVLYGSNALGGVINFITRSSPIDYTDEGYAYGGRTRITYISLTKGLRARIEGYGATPDFKILAGYSRANYGNARRGGDGKVLDPTGGKEENFDVRGDYRVAPGHELTLAIQRVHRWNIHRYYNPRQSQDNVNDRLGVAFTWNAERLLDFLTDFEWRISYQDKREERTDYANPSHYFGYAETKSYSTDLQASTDLGSGHYLTYGLHAHVDDGESPGDEELTYTIPASTGADAPNSLWANYGVFVQDEWNATDDLTLTGAMRFDYFVFNARSTDNFLRGDPDREKSFFRDTNTSFTGGLGASYALDPDWRVLANYSRGYRQPEPHFGVTQVGVGIHVPAELLDPITSDNFELGLRCRKSAFHAEGFVFYSRLAGFTDWKRGSYEGKDWYDINRSGTREKTEDVFTLQNTDKAYITGTELKGTVYIPQVVDEFPAGWSIWGGFAWTYGRVGNDDYIRHGQPPRGLVGIRWDDSDPDRAAYFEFVTEMVGKFKYVPDGRKGDLAWVDDPQNPNSGLLRSYNGVPGYTVFNAYAGMNLCENARLNVGIENITDKEYRRAHSRMDAFGLNVTVGLDITF